MEFEVMKAMLAKYGGWVEDLGDGEFVARFPSVWQKEQFEKDSFAA